MSYSIRDQNKINIGPSTGFMCSNTDNNLNFNLDFTFGNQSSLNLTLESWITLYHEPEANISAGDQVTIFAGVTEGESSVLLTLQNLGDYAALEGEYTFIVDNALGTVSIPIPGASADIPILGNVTVYLEGQFLLRIDLEDSGPGEFVETNSKELSESSLKEFKYQILSSASKNDIIIIKASYTLIFKDLEIKLKALGLTVFSLEIQKVNKEKTLINLLEDEILVESSSDTTGFEGFSIFIWLIVLTSIRTKLTKLSKSKKGKGEK